MENYNFLSWLMMAGVIILSSFLVYMVFAA